MLQRGHFIKHTTHGPKVRFVVVRFILPDLRAQVVWSTNARSCIICRSVHDFCNAEITEFYDHSALFRARNEYILRLDIPVQYLPFVNILHCPAYLHEESQNDLFWKQFATLPVDFAIEVATIAILHDDLNHPEERFKSNIRLLVFRV